MHKTSHLICLSFNHHNTTGQIPISIDDFKAPDLSSPSRVSDVHDKPRIVKKELGECESLPAQQSIPLSHSAQNHVHTTFLPSGRFQLHLSKTQPHALYQHQIPLESPIANLHPAATSHPHPERHKSTYCGRCNHQR